MKRKKIARLALAPRDRDCACSGSAGMKKKEETEIPFCLFQSITLIHRQVGPVTWTHCSPQSNHLHSVIFLLHQTPHLWSLLYRPPNIFKSKMLGTVDQPLLRILLTVPYVRQNYAALERLYSSSRILNASAFPPVFCERQLGPLL